MHFSFEKITLRRAVILLCAVILLGGAFYVGTWLAKRSYIIEKSNEYSDLYQPAQTSVVFTTTESITEYPSVKPTEFYTIAPTQSPTDAPLPSVVDQPIATPDGNTLVISLPTPPPVQSSFNDLLKLNPETVGFLRIDGVVSLPVVQRENDNSFYLTHNFEQTEADEGALFLDGMNRLSPEDDCLIIYGHNMHNGTMFGEIDHYDETDFLKSHPLVHFDTLYENRVYVPIAAFPASMNPDSGSYFDVRQIAFDESSFDLFLMRLKSRSVIDIPADAYYGDRLLLLVTCDYTKDDGRFILALRQLRADETEDEARALVMSVDSH